MSKPKTESMFSCHNDIPIEIDITTYMTLCAIVNIIVLLFVFISIPMSSPQKWIVELIPFFINAFLHFLYLFHGENPFLKEMGQFKPKVVCYYVVDSYKSSLISMIFTPAIAT